MVEGEHLLKNLGWELGQEPVIQKRVSEAGFIISQEIFVTVEGDENRMIPRTNLKP